MSIAPPPPVYPSWPPAPYPPPAPPARKRRWPAITAAAGISAVVAALVTTLITVKATAPEPAVATAPEEVTVTAAPAPPPAPLPAAEADKQTCRAWSTTSTLFTQGASAQGIIPQGMTITDPAVQSNPAWKGGVLKASDFYAQAANTLETQLAPGTTPMLSQIASTSVSALRTLSEAYKTFDPAAGNSMAVFQETQQAMDWLCRS